MGKFDYRDLPARERRKMLDELVEVFVTLRERKDIYTFLQRLLTPSEITMLARRLRVAELLVSGASYKTVQDRLGVGMSTIRATDSWLEHSVRDYQMTRDQLRRDAKSAQRHAEKLKRRRRPSNVPGTLSHLVEHDSRYILVKLLVGK